MLLCSANGGPLNESNYKCMICYSAHKVNKELFLLYDNCKDNKDVMDEYLTLLCSAEGGCTWCVPFTFQGSHLETLTSCGL